MRLSRPPIAWFQGLFGRKSQSFVLLTAFIISSLTPLKAEELSLPKPGMMVRLSSAFVPAILKGIKVHPDNPFKFDFVLDKGDGYADKDQLKVESTKLIKYFLASLTVPEEDLWVNLSPYEKDRIVPDTFGQTEMGRDLLAQDYMLKQITASLIYPEDEIGKKFWKRIYEEAAKKFGTKNISVNTFNKVWIVPEKAVVYENAKAGTAYVVESKLKVMLEQDYLAMTKNDSPAFLKRGLGGVNQLGSQIVREVVIPALTKEINTGRNFAQLRQVYNAYILASWYKQTLKESIINSQYSDKRKVNGIALEDKGIAAKIYNQYLQAFKKGVFNYIKDTDTPNGVSGPRKYFSGGVKFYAKLEINHDGAMIAPGKMTSVSVVFKDVMGGVSPFKKVSQDAYAYGRKLVQGNLIVQRYQFRSQGQIMRQMVDSFMSLEVDFERSINLGALNGNLAKIKRLIETYQKQLPSSGRLNKALSEYGRQIDLRYQKIIVDGVKNRRAYQEKWLLFPYVMFTGAGPGAQRQDIDAYYIRKEQNLLNDTPALAPNVSAEEREASLAIGEKYKQRIKLIVERIEKASRYYDLSLRYLQWRRHVKDGLIAVVLTLPLMLGSSSLLISPQGLLEEIPHQKQIMDIGVVKTVTPMPKPTAEIKLTPVDLNRLPNKQRQEIEELINETRETVKENPKVEEVRKIIDALKSSIGAKLILENARNFEATDGYLAFSSKILQPFLVLSNEEFSEQLIQEVFSAGQRLNPQIVRPLENIIRLSKANFTPDISKAHVLELKSVFINAGYYLFVKNVTVEGENKILAEATVIDRTVIFADEAIEKLELKGNYRPVQVLIVGLPVNFPLNKNIQGFTDGQYAIAYRDNNALREQSTVAHEAGHRFREQMHKKGMKGSTNEELSAMIFPLILYGEEYVAWYLKNDLFARVRDIDSPKNAYKQGALGIINGLLTLAGSSHQISNDFKNEEINKAEEILSQRPGAVIQKDAVRLIHDPRLTQSGDGWDPSAGENEEEQVTAPIDLPVRKRMPQEPKAIVQKITEITKPNVPSGVSEDIQFIEKYMNLIEENWFSFLLQSSLNDFYDDFSRRLSLISSEQELVWFYHYVTVAFNNRLDFGKFGDKYVDLLRSYENIRFEIFKKAALNNWLLIGFGNASNNFHYGSFDLGGRRTFHQYEYELAYTSFYMGRVGPFNLGHSFRGISAFGNNGHNGHVWVNNEIVDLNDPKKYQWGEGEKASFLSYNNSIVMLDDGRWLAEVSVVGASGGSFRLIGPAVERLPIDQISYRYNLGKIITLADGGWVAAVQLLNNELSFIGVQQGQFFSVPTKVWIEAWKAPKGQIEAWKTPKGGWVGAVWVEDGYRFVGALAEIGLDPNKVYSGQIEVLLENGLMSEINSAFFPMIESIVLPINQFSTGWVMGVRLNTGGNAFVGRDAGKEFMYKTDAKIVQIYADRKGKWMGVVEKRRFIGPDLPLLGIDPQKEYSMEVEGILRTIYEGSLMNVVAKDVKEALSADGPYLSLAFSDTSNPSVIFQAPDGKVRILGEWARETGFDKEVFTTARHLPESQLILAYRLRPDGSTVDYIFGPGLKTIPNAQLPEILRTNVHSNANGVPYLLMDGSFNLESLNRTGLGLEVTGVRYAKDGTQVFIRSSPVHTQRFAIPEGYALFGQTFYNSNSHIRFDDEARAYGFEGQILPGAFNQRIGPMNIAVDSRDRTKMVIGYLAKYLGVEGVAFKSISYWKGKAVLVSVDGKVYVTEVPNLVAYQYRTIESPMPQWTSFEAAVLTGNLDAASAELADILSYQSSERYLAPMDRLRFIQIIENNQTIFLQAAARLDTVNIINLINALRQSPVAYLILDVLDGQDKDVVSNILTNVWPQAEVMAAIRHYKVKHQVTHPLDIEFTLGFRQSWEFQAYHVFSNPYVAFTAVKATMVPEGEIFRWWDINQRFNSSIGAHIQGKIESLEKFSLLNEIVYNPMLMSYILGLMVYVLVSVGRIKKTDLNFFNRNTMSLVEKIRKDIGKEGRPASLSEQLIFDAITCLAGERQLRAEPFNWKEHLLKVWIPGWVINQLPFALMLKDRRQMNYDIVALVQESFDEGASFDPALFYKALRQILKKYEDKSVHSRVMDERGVSSINISTAFRAAFNEQWPVYMDFLKTNPRLAKQVQDNLAVEGQTDKQAALVVDLRDMMEDSQIKTGWMDQFVENFYFVMAFARQHRFIFIMPDGSIKSEQVTIDGDLRDFNQIYQDYFEPNLRTALTIQERVNQINGLRFYGAEANGRYVHRVLSRVNFGDYLTQGITSDTVRQVLIGQLDGVEFVQFTGRFIKENSGYYKRVSGLHPFQISDHGLPMTYFSLRQILLENVSLSEKDKPAEGGINLNPKGFNVERQGDWVNFQKNSTSPNNAQINSLFPEIIQIVPDVDVRGFLGLPNAQFY